MTLNRRAFLHTSLALMSAGAAAIVPATDSAAASGTLVEGGTLTYAIPQEPPSLVSLLDTNTAIRNISAKITEGLLRYDAQIKPQPL